MPSDPILPDIRFAADTAADWRFAFAGDDAVPCPHLAGNADSEAWRVGPDFRFIALRTEDTGDLVADSRRVYADLLAQVRGSSHPYLIRIWNYFADINRGDEDTERYRQFCVGRAQAVDAEFNDPPPAATAIGSPRNDGLQVIALCSNRPAVALENPRQTPAWQYPRQYGRVSPGFSRGAVLNAGSAAPVLLASGTASIVGHASVHIGDTAEQCRESLRNLQALLDEGERRCGARFRFADCRALRVYVRDPAELDTVRAVFETGGIPPRNIAYLHGDVCRRELAVELEGVFPAA